MELLGVSVMILDSVHIAEERTLGVECFNSCTNAVIPPSSPMYCLLEVNDDIFINASQEAFSTKSSYIYTSCDQLVM